MFAIIMLNGTKLIHFDRLTFESIEFDTRESKRYYLVKTQALCAAITLFSFCLEFNVLWCFDFKIMMEINSPELFELHKLSVRLCLLYLHYLIMKDSE